MWFDIFSKVHEKFKEEGRYGEEEEEEEEEEGTD